MRWGAEGPEPPRPTDLDLHHPGMPTRGRPHMDGFVLDPTASTGPTDGLVRVELTSSYVAADTGEEVREESRRATTTHPNVILLPVSYTISGRLNGVWGQRGPAVYVSPQAAREDGSFSMNGFVFDNNTGAEEFRAAYELAWAAHQPPRTDDFKVDDVPCRVTRVETFVRFGPDGPEGPRPSDRDSYPPPARQAHDLRVKGLMSEPD